MHIQFFDRPKSATTTLGPRERHPLIVFHSDPNHTKILSTLSHTEKNIDKRMFDDAMCSWGPGAKGRDDFYKWGYIIVALETVPRLAIVEKRYMEGKLKNLLLAPSGRATTSAVAATVNVFNFSLLFLGINFEFDLTTQKSHINEQHILSLYVTEWPRFAPPAPPFDRQMISTNTCLNQTRERDREEVVLGGIN